MSSMPKSWVEILYCTYKKHERQIADKRKEILRYGYSLRSHQPSTLSLGWCFERLMLWGFTPQSRN